jgi:histone-lysine N-methyltransferase SETMAR
VKRWCQDRDDVAEVSFADKVKSGRSTSSSSQVTVDKVMELIQEDPRLSTRDVSYLLAIGHMTVHRILTEDLNLRYVCAVWIPHVLSEETRKLRVAAAKSIRRKLTQLGDDAHSLYVTEDETWIPFSSTLTKAENKVWG